MVGELGRIKEKTSKREGKKENKIKHAICGFNIVLRGLLVSILGRKSFVT
jgi:hypothetical protein